MNVLKISLLLFFSSLQASSSSDAAKEEVACLAWKASIRYNDYFVLLEAMNHRSGDVPLGKKLVDLGFGFEPDARNKIIKYMYSGLCPQGISDKVLWIVAQQRGAQQH